MQCDECLRLHAEVQRLNLQNERLQKVVDAAVAYHQVEKFQGDPEGGFEYIGYLWKAVEEYKAMLALKPKEESQFCEGCHAGWPKDFANYHLMPRGAGRVSCSIKRKGEGCDCGATIAFPTHQPGCQLGGPYDVPE